LPLDLCYQRVGWPESRMGEKACSILCSDWSWIQGRRRGRRCASVLRERGTFPRDGERDKQCQASNSTSSLMQRIVKTRQQELRELFHWGTAQERAELQAGSSVSRLFLQKSSNLFSTVIFLVYMAKGRKRNFQARCCFSARGMEENQAKGHNPAFSANKLDTGKPWRASFGSNLDRTRDLFLPVVPFSIPVLQFRRDERTGRIERSSHVSSDSIQHCNSNSPKSKQ
jgi:hypothetical protein